MTIRAPWVLILLFPLFLGVSSSRPQLVGSRVLPLQAIVASEKYEYLLTTLEFDQDVYVNDPFVCAGQDQGCVKTGCEACDWSGEMPTDCTNPNCCGPAQWPTYPSSNRLNEWCDSTFPPYTKLDFGVRSDDFVLAEGEYKYFRFFIGEEHYCRSVRFEVSTVFGDFSITSSNFVAYPNQTSLSTIENGQQFLASSMTKADPTSNYAKNYLDLCPNVNPTYERGTYSIALMGFHPQNKGTIKLYLGEEEYPIPPQEDRISCDDVPNDEYQGANYGIPEEFGGSICVEDGVTKDIFSIPNLWWDIVLPIQPGCQEISLAYNGYTSTNTDGSDTTFLLFCGQSSELSFGANLNSAIIRSLRINLNHVYLSACFEEVTYLHCNGYSFGPPGEGKILWSSTTKPIRHKLSETEPAMITTNYGQYGTGGALHPELNYEGISAWGFDGYSWLTQPSTDPLVFYPPSSIFSYNFTQDPLETFVDAGLTETQSRIVNIVDLTTRRNTVLRSQETLLKEGFIYILGVTGATGLPVELCNDDDFGSGKCDRGAPLVDRNSWTDFMSTRTFSTLNLVDLTECNEDSYNRELALVQTELDGALKSSSLDFIAQKAYLSDLYNAGFARSSCLRTMENILRTREDNVTRLEKNFCPFEPLSPEWLVDPCCNIRAEAAFCCAPQSLLAEDDLYTEADPVELDDFCRNSDCDDSFFTDIASSLNALGNALVGCASGIEDPEYELDVLIESEMATFVRPCLVEAGFGDNFLGVNCISDNDCVFLGTSCDHSEGICRLGTTEETRERYFNCFVSTLPPKIEDYIRREVLPPVDSEYPKDSKYFRASLREAASRMDCVAVNPLDIGFGERYAANSGLFCKGVGLGYQSLAEMEANEAFITSICPEYQCLGERSCRFELAKQCKSTENPGQDCLDTYHSYIPPSLSSCPTEQTSCNAKTQLEQLEGCAGYECVICLSPNPSDTCVIVDGVSDEEECEQLVACEMPDGTLRFDLNEDECQMMGDCSADCDGLECRSVDGLKGVCVVEGGLSSCESFGGEVVGDSCLLVSVTNEYLCAQTQDIISQTTEWATCQSLDLDTCSNHSSFSDPYVYLRCFIDNYRECQNEQECLNSGTCSDIEITKKVIPDPSGWFSVFYGTCLSSGVTGVFENREPACWTPIGETQFKFGCHFGQADEGLCAYWGSPAAPLYPLWTSWITPARTQDTCQQEIQGRYGCAIPKKYEKTYWFWNETDCDCLQGTGDYLFSWTPGTWTQGKSHSAVWKEKNQIFDYSWQETISIVRMEEWVRNAVEAWFVYIIKSQLVCETNYVTSSLSTLVCDCVGKEDSEGSSCYPSNIATEVGITGACASEESVLKGPSSFTTFSGDSISDLCTEAVLSLIQRSWFLFPRSSSSVSFRFAERGEKGIVVNGNDATVGEVVGDGSKISFKSPERVSHFRTCLLIDRDEVGKYEDDYPIRDFGLLSSDITSMTPLGLGGEMGDREGRIEVEDVELFTYWCAEITREELERGDEDGITLFPILRIENYEDEEDNSLSHRTESLIYTLAALYLFDLLLVLVFIVVMFKNHISEGRQVPLATWMGVIFGIVCLFRVVFCFIYVDDGFSDLAEYVVFEIPTFLLFTGVILVTAMFMKLSKKKSFDFTSHDRKLTIFAIFSLIVVWSLFIIVTIIYSEVILEENEDSVCPGRVQSSNEDIEEDTRTLSIIYQSIVISLTLIFALVFLRQSTLLFKMTKNSAANELVFRLGFVIVTCFLLRCILFLILLAVDFTSDIYLFLTLFFTEVVMIFLISIELNKRFYTSIVSSATLSGSRSKTTPTNAPQGTSVSSNSHTLKGQ